VSDQSAENRDQVLQEVLQLCEEFFGQASAVTREELDAFLRARGNYGGPGLLIDMLGFARYRLQHHQHAGTETTPDKDLNQQ